MASMKIISSQSEFGAAERAVEAELAKPSASADAAHILGYIRNREAYPLSGQVCFLASDDLAAVARVEQYDAEKVDISLFVAQSVDDSVYRVLVDTLVGPSPDVGKRIMASSVPARREKIWTEVLQEKGMEVGTREDLVWFMRDRGASSVSKVAEEFCLEVVKCSDVEMVSHLWPYGGSGAASYLGNMITSYPTMCVRRSHEPHDLVGWILTYPYGALGSLHVMEAQRKRGFGGLLIEELSTKLLAASRARGHADPVVYAYAAVGNTASIGLFGKLATWRMCEEQAHWLIASPRSEKATTSFRDFVSRNA